MKGLTTGSTELAQATSESVSNWTTKVPCGFWRRLVFPTGREILQFFGEPKAEPEKCFHVDVNATKTVVVD